MNENQKSNIMTPEEAADFLKVSVSWVHKNWKIIGGIKLKGVLRFPSKEDIYECVFSKGERLAFRFHDRGDKTYPNLVQNETRSQDSRKPKTRGGETRITKEDPFGLRVVAGKKT